MESIVRRNGKYLRTLKVDVKQTLQEEDHCDQTAALDYLGTGGSTFLFHVPQYLSTWRLPDLDSI